MTPVIGILAGAAAGLGWWGIRGLFRKRPGKPGESDPWKNVAYGVLLGLFGSVFYAYSGLGGPAKAEESKYVRTFSEANWEKEVMKSEKPVLVDFWAPWCGPCRMEGPIVSRVAEEEADAVIVGKVNADENQGLMRRYGIQAIPTLMVFRKGEPVRTFVGLTGGSDLKDALQAGEKP